VNAHPSGAGPRNISLILTQSLLLLLAKSVSDKETQIRTISDPAALSVLTQVIPAVIRRRALVDFAWQALQKANGYVPIRERKRFAQEAAGVVHALAAPCPSVL